VASFARPRLHADAGGHEHDGRLYPDGGRLVDTTKANGNNIDVFAMNRFGGLSAKPVVNGDPGQVPFAATFDAGGHLVVF
jgi:hypothetical protein